MSARKLDIIFVSVAALGILGGAYYYVVGGAHKDRLLSRAAGVTCAVLGVASVAYWWRVF